MGSHFNSSHPTQGIEWRHLQRATKGLTGRADGRLKRFSIRRAHLWSFVLVVLKINIFRVKCWNFLFSVSVILSDIHRSFALPSFILPHGRLHIQMDYYSDDDESRVKYSALHGLTPTFTLKMLCTRDTDETRRTVLHLLCRFHSETSTTLHWVGTDWENVEYSIIIVIRRRVFSFHWLISSPPIN